MELLLLVGGAVLVVEGLVLALAPSRIVDLLAALARLTPEARRLVGLIAVAGGGVLVALARMAGG